MPNTVLTLYDHSGSLTDDNEFRDVDTRLAYYCQAVRRSPLSCKITRMPDWPYKAHPDREPWTSWIYFTSSETMEGYVKFGGGEPSPMTNHLQRSNETSRCVSMLPDLFLAYHPLQIPLLYRPQRQDVQMETRISLSTGG